MSNSSEKKEEAGAKPRLSGLLRAVVGRIEPKPIGVFKLLLPFKGFSIILVVMAHSAISLLTAEVNKVGDGSLTPILFSSWQVASAWKTVVLELCRCSVPMFLFVSGYYMLFSPRTWKATWSSCKKLIIPMAFWSLLAWAFSWRTLSGGWSVLEFLGLFFTGKSQLGYFFIILIIQYYILSKWLVPAIAKRPWLTMGAVVLIQLSVHAYDYLYLLGSLGAIPPIGWISSIGSFPEFLFPRFIIPFALGIWASQYKDAFRKLIEGRMALLGAIAACFALLLIAERGFIFNVAFNGRGMSAFDATMASWVEWKGSTTLWSIAAILFAVSSLQRWIPMRKCLELVGKYSFQIFILHGMVLGFVRMVFYKYLDGVPYYGLLGFLGMTLVSVAVPIIATKAIQRWMPRAIRTLMLGS